MGTCEGDHKGTTRVRIYGCTSMVESLLMGRRLLVGKQAGPRVPRSECGARLEESPGEHFTYQIYRSTTLFTARIDRKSGISSRAAVSAFEALSPLLMRWAGISSR